MTPLNADTGEAGAAIQSALAVLTEHWNREHELSRHIREPRTRERIAAWEIHAEGCERRAADYFGLASKLPKAHRDHEYYLTRAQEQLNKARFARQQIKIEENSL